MPVSISSIQTKRIFKSMFEYQYFGLRPFKDLLRRFKKYRVVGYFLEKLLLDLIFLALAFELRRFQPALCELVALRHFQSSSHFTPPCTNLSAINFDFLYFSLLRLHFSLLRLKFWFSHMPIGERTPLMPIWGRTKAFMRVLDWCFERNSLPPLGHEYQIKFDTSKYNNHPLSQPRTTIFCKKVGKAFDPPEIALRRRSSHAKGSSPKKSGVLGFLRISQMTGRLRRKLYSKTQFCCSSQWRQLFPFKRLNFSIFWRIHTE